MARKTHLCIASSLILALGAAMLMWPVPGTAQSGLATCEYPLFVQRTGADANVVLLFDNSGSMNEAMWHPDFDPAYPYSGGFSSQSMYYVDSDGTYEPSDFSYKLPSSPSAKLVDSDHGESGRYIGNYLNWIYYHATDEQRANLPVVTRIQVGKAVVSDLVQRTDGVQFGIAQFNTSDGGKVTSPVGTPTPQLLDELDDIVGDTWTPLGETMLDIVDYLEDEDSTPIQYSCQTTFLIVVTDGFPTMDRDHGLASRIGDQDGDGHEPGSCASIGAPYNNDNDCSDYMDDVAYYLANTDLSDFNKTQNCVTYTVGFNIDAGILAETAENGQGLYFSADSAEELWLSLATALNDIISRRSSGTAAAVVSSETSTEGRLYRARFKPGTWQGYLEAYQLPYADGDSPVWRAQSKLNNKDAATRNIYTSTTGTNKITFDATKIDNLKPLFGTSDEAYASDIIAYHRGIDSPEYRDRDGWRLGDIIDSSPVVVGAPSYFYDYDDYGAFRTDNLERDELVYIASNDGMLHAFRTANGVEKWAYIPKSILPRLTELMDKSYCHDFYLNATPKVVDAYVDDAWRTVLICGQREGGNGLFALDVTDPRAGQFKVMWDIEMPTDAYTWSPVAVGRDKASDKFLCFVGSGPDSTNGLSQLHALDLKDGSVVWSDVLGTTAGVNMANSPTLIDRDFDGYDDLVYVTDFEGFVWRVDLEANPWKVSKLFDAGQPISAPPVLTMDDHGNVLAFFGTGRYLKAEDPDDTSQNTFYGVRDDHSGNTYDRDDLVDQTSTISEVGATDHGWFIDLNNGAGERVIKEAALVAGTLYFTSFQPSTQICQAGGKSWLYEVDYEDGSAPDNDDGTESDDVADNESIGSGVFSEPIIDLANEDVIIQSSDTSLLVRDTRGEILRVLVRSWRQIYQ